MSKDWRRGTSSNSNSFDDSGNGDGPNSNGGYSFFGVDDEDSSSSSSSDEEAGFFVRIETIMGSKFQVYTYASDNVELLKTRIAFQEGIPQKDQHLFLSHGKIALDDSTVLLADLGLNEATAKYKPFRLLTNVSSGIGSKSYADPSPPPVFPPLPVIPHPFFSNRRKEGSGNRGEGRCGQEKESVRLPKLGSSEDAEGVIVLKDRDEHQVFLLVKNGEEPFGVLPPHHNSNLIRGCKISSNATKAFEEIEKKRNSILSDDGLFRRGDLINGRRQFEPRINQLSKIRENARTLEKMTKIKIDMFLKKRTPPFDAFHDDREPFQDLESENQLPDINEKHNYKNMSNIPHKDKSPTSITSQMSYETYSTDTTFSRTITSSVANLNRLQAELYLEAKKTGGGNFGVLPYTEEQLAKYVRLKVKVLLADQNPDEYDYYSRHKFVHQPEAHSLLPTVVIARQQDEQEQNHTARGDGIIYRNELRSSNGLNAGRSRNSDSSSSTSDVSILKEQNNILTRLVTARKLNSDDSIKPARLRKQESQTTLKSGNISARNIRSACRRPTSGSNAAGTSSTIQKKKKDIVRCSECRKRIGVACRYQCRCGKMFCSTHRYAETHNCTFDYKTEGRRQLQEANPLIVGKKVDKI